MPRLFHPKTVDLADWREAPTVVRIRTRLAELEPLIREGKEALAAHAVLVADAEAVARRSELEVLAGRGSEQALADAARAHTLARTEDAKTRLAVEDAEAEQAKLLAEQPTVERAAKMAAKANLRVAYVARLKVVAEKLAEVVAADAELAVVWDKAARQFGDYTIANRELYDATLPFAAGLPRLAYCEMWQGRREEYTVAGHAQGWQETIERAIAHLTA
jgi:hypothetical protein